jgi:uncharacterized protein (TIGR03032 family)
MSKVMPVPKDATAGRLEALWAHHHAVLRDPHQIISQWSEASDIDPVLLQARARGSWWEVLGETSLTLLVTREYEHLVMALCVHAGRPRVSFLHLPHPSGVAVDRVRKRVYIASTRNPNQVLDFAPCSGAAGQDAVHERHTSLLLPVGAHFLPGCLYTHDLALIRGKLYANAVGLNAVVRFGADGGFQPVWWPRCLDTKRGPRLDRNYLQLNSIAAGMSLEQSYFSASTDRPSHRRPGHLNFRVDGRGVIFSGATREVFGRGLTRPHSARRRGDEVWVDNSGYGEVGRIVDGRFESVVKLSGWTRGLFFHGQIAFVATSRVLLRHRAYAPGLDPDKCETGIHAIDISTGRVLGSMLWPYGNQVFAIEGIEKRVTRGFPFVRPGDRGCKRLVELFSRCVAA